MRPDPPAGDQTASVRPGLEPIEPNVANATGLKCADAHDAVGSGHAAARRPDVERTGGGARVLKPRRDRPRA